MPNGNRPWVPLVILLLAVNARPQDVKLEAGQPVSREIAKMLKPGERPAAALREAQVAMWKQIQWRSPYYWASFVMQGEWRWTWLSGSIGRGELKVQSFPKGRR